MKSGFCIGGGMFDYIREFQTLAEHLNFTSAARELGLSQSGLSRHMAALEHDLGFELLTRSPVRLTPAGARYLERVGGILDAHDQLVRECAALSKNQTPALRIAMAESSGQPACMAYAILASMHESDEGFSYELVVDRAKTVEQLVQESAADVALAYCAPGDGIDEGPAAASSPWEAPMADVAYDFMYNEPLSAWVHEDNPVFEGDATLEDLAACKLPISSNRMFKTWTDGICALFERNGCRPKNAHQGRERAQRVPRGAQGRRGRVHLELFALYGSRYQPECLRGRSCVGHHTCGAGLPCLSQR